MHDVSHESADPAALLEEIVRLRSDIQILSDKVLELEALAYRDPLVPLANRRGMLRDLEAMIARHQRHAIPSAVLFVDLDDLKILNDSFGHGGGDVALIHVAEKLLMGTRANDTVARLGGDEFCVLLDHADDRLARDIAERLVKLIAGEDCVYQSSPMPLSVAIGVTLIEAGDTPATVLARADQAMYRVKAAA